MNRLDRAIYELRYALFELVEPSKCQDIIDILNKWKSDNFVIYNQQYLVSRPELVNDPKFLEHVKREMATEMALALYEQSGTDRVTREPNPQFRDIPEDEKKFYSPCSKRIQVELIALKNKTGRK